MTLDELRNLDPAEYGRWPMQVKLVCCLLLLVLMLVGFWYLTLQGKREELHAAQQQEEELRKTFESKQTQAASLPLLKEQLAQIEESFGDLLRQLPDKEEIESLLVDISQQGLTAELEFRLFRPGKEETKEFYAERPIQIEVIGTYHKFGEFISGVSSLPRIVTTHDIKIQSNAAQRGKGAVQQLSMSLRAKTYRALSAEGEEGG